MHTPTRIHARALKYTYTHARTRTYTHARTHARTYTIERSQILGLAVELPGAAIESVDDLMIAWCNGRGAPFICLFACGWSRQNVGKSLRLTYKGDVVPITAVQRTVVGAGCSYVGSM